MLTLKTFVGKTTDVKELLRPDGGRYSVTSISASYAWCRALATNHYENFPVASILVPASMRPHMVAVYAFSRLADDTADEAWTSHNTERYAGLDFLDAAIDASLDTTGHPIFTALRETMTKRDLAPDLFHRLVQAFRSDIEFTPPTSWADVLEYCHYSANPVGELVLRIDGNPNSNQIALSDMVCSALQITNFVADVHDDARRGRAYLPAPLQESIHFARDLFKEGAGVVDGLHSWRMKQELKMIIAGGVRVLDKLEALGSWRG